MILHKETFKKFGYWPKDLLPGSNKKIFYKCKCCKNQIMTDNYHYQKKKSHLCKTCSSKKTSIAMSANREIQWFDVIGANLTAIQVCELHFAGSLTETSAENPYIRIYSKRKLKILTVKESIAICKFLKLTKKTTNSVSFKKACLKYLLTQPRAERFNLINYVFANYAKLSQHKDGRYTFSDYYNVLRPLLDSVGVKYLTYNCRKASIARIIQGSFYINGQWLHIGE